MIENRDVRASQNSRRAFTIAGSGAVAALAFNLRYGIKMVEAKAGAPKEVKIVEFSLSDNGKMLSLCPSLLKRTLSGSSSYRQTPMR